MRHSWAVLALAAVAAAGCVNPDSPRGFTLPPGDADRGREAFVELQCTSCHEVVGERLTRPEDPEITIRLGGETVRVRTYGELVTSVIHPSHRIAEGWYPPEHIAPLGVSRMTIYNDVMTVTQLVDLVTFLEEHYELPRYTPTDYPLLP